MRILHAPTSTGGNAFGLSQAERAIGLESDVVIYDKSFLDYPGTVKLDLSGYPKPIRALKQFELFRSALKKYDIFHFNFGRGLLSFGRFGLLDIEMPIYKRGGKKIIVTYNGCDARQKYYSMSNFAVSPCAEPDCYGGCCSARSDRVKKDRISKIAKYADRIFALNPDLLNILPEGAEFRPYTKPDLDSLLSAPIEKNKGGKFKILHAPSNRSVKGTKYILPVVERIKSEYRDVEILLVENTPHIEAREIYKEADLVIEQVLLGWYSGVAVEAMALGKPVITYIRQEDLRFVPSLMAKELPVINAAPDTLYDVIRKAVEDRERLIETGRKGRAYIRKWHDPIKIAERMKSLYETLLGVRPCAG